MFVVTLPGNQAHDASNYARAAQESGADILEIRGDLTPDLEMFDSCLPLLLSPREHSLSQLMDQQPAFVDLDFTENLDLDLGSNRTQLIRSFHDFEKTPTLEELKATMESLIAKNPKADYFKVATQICGSGDLLALQRLHEEFATRVAISIMGMGPKAWPNRVLSPWLNPFTYVAIHENEIAAPGQLLLKDLKALGNDQAPALFAILGGNDLKSLSPKIHNGLFARHKVHAFYGAWPTACAAQDFDVLKELGFRGFSVTSPHKITMRDKMDAIDASAETLPSTNTCSIQEGSWTGYQTDAFGIVNGYPELRGVNSVAIVGSGGVVPSVVVACRQLGAQKIKIFARNEHTRGELASGLQIDHGRLDELVQSKPDLLIWTLPVDVAEIRLPQAPRGRFALDLRYGKSTEFLDQARQLGYCVHDGLNMLKHQALAQFEIFSGKITTSDDRNFLDDLLSTHVQ